MFSWLFVGKCFYFLRNKACWNQRLRREGCKSWLVLKALNELLGVGSVPPPAVRFLLTPPSLAPTQPCSCPWPTMAAAARPLQRARPSTTRTPAAPDTCSPCPRLPTACRRVWKSKLEPENCSRVGSGRLSVITRIKGGWWVRSNVKKR